MVDPAFTGSCACGRITYKCSNAPMACSACHCVTCRKLSGAAYQTFATVKANEITYHDGKDDVTLSSLPTDSFHGIEIFRYVKSSDRAFCVDCHTPLAMRYMHAPHAHSITLGSVDEESAKDDHVRDKLRPERHIFVTQKVPWCEGIGSDRLVQFERFSGNFEEAIRAWEKTNA